MQLRGLELDVDAASRKSRLVASDSIMHSVTAAGEDEEAEELEG